MAQSKGRRVQPREKRHTAAKVVCILLIVALLLAGGAVFIINHELNKIDRIDRVEFIHKDDEDFETDEGAGADTIDGVEWDENLEAVDDSGVTNILLVGQDTRVPGERARSDSMMILSINEKAGQISLISLMRDLYVQIPGYSDNRINAAYRFGGTELLDQVIEKNFGVTIDYNAEVDFTGFKQIVDLLGGVDITLTSEEAKYFQEIGLSVTEGTNHVDGQTALTYAQTRYVATATEANDFGRTQRQRAVLNSIFAAYKDVGIMQKLTIADQVLPLISTDMTNGQIIELLYQIQGMGLGEMDTYRIPADGAYSSETIRGMMVLVPDLEANRALLQQIMDTSEETN